MNLEFFERGTMNLASDASRNQLVGLLSQCNDNAAHHLLWVTQKGEVHIAPLSAGLSAAAFAHQNAEEMKFRLEVFQRGSGYVGSAASQDLIWVNRLYQALTRFWTNDAKGCLDSF